MRASGIVLLVTLVACTDLRDYQGEWRGARVGDSAALRVGVATEATATLAIDAIDTRGLRGALTIDGLVESVPFQSLEGAEADALATMTFSGAPMRVYLAFVEAQGGALLAMVALYDSGRVEVRVMRGGDAPVYAIFALTQS